MGKNEPDEDFNNYAAGDYQTYLRIRKIDKNINFYSL